MHFQDVTLHKMWKIEPYGIKSESSTLRLNSIELFSFWIVKSLLVIYIRKQWSLRGCGHSLGISSWYYEALPGLFGKENWCVSRRVAFHSCRQHMGCVFIVLPFPHSKTPTHCSRQQCAWPKTPLAKYFNACNMWTVPVWLLCLHHPSLNPSQSRSMRF